MSQVMSTGNSDSHALVDIPTYLNTIRHGPALRLIREPEVDAERRVHVALELALLGEGGGVVVEDLYIVGVEVDDLEVRLDARLGDRFGEHCAASGDWRYDTLALALDLLLTCSPPQSRYMRFEKGGEDLPW